MNVVAIIQARMSSTRFPGKHLAPLDGKPMIAHVIERCRMALNSIVVAVASESASDPLAFYLDKVGQKCFRGSTRNPLLRTYECAKHYNATAVVRITGDCPLIDGRTIESLINRFADKGEVDYVGRTNSPDGDDCEVFSFQALKDAANNATYNESEHVTTWIRKNKKCESIESDPAYADVHYSVNTVDDLKTCELLLQRAGEGARWQDYCVAYREIMGEKK